eukprot:COSAG02_NODE_10049_length_2038_cov_2.604951_3_plen_22_part_01
MSIGVAMCVCVFARQTEKRAKA